MSMPSHPSISSSSSSRGTPVARRRPVAATVPPTLPYVPYYPTEIALPPPPPVPYVSWRAASSDGNAAGGGGGNVGAKAELQFWLEADSWPALADSVSWPSPKSSASGSRSGSPKDLSDGSSTASDSKGVDGGGGNSSSSAANGMAGVADERSQEYSSTCRDRRNMQSPPQMMQQGVPERNISGRPGGIARNWRHGSPHGKCQNGGHWNGHPAWTPLPPLRTQPQPLLLRPLAPPVFAPILPHGNPFFSPPMGFTGMDPSPPYRPRGPPPFETLKQMPFIGPQVPPEVPLALLFPQVPQPRPKLKEQIEYYFSDENLCKDVFLRRHMDDQGWVPVSLIATFNRVKLLTSNIQHILDTLQDSKVVEVQGEKIRRRDKWMNWLLPSPQTYDSLVGSRAGTVSQSSNNQTPAQDSGKPTQSSSRPPQ